MENNKIITIGRQWGSGGKSICKELSLQLAIPFYDKELLYIASKESGISKEFFEQVDEKKNFNFLSGFQYINMGFLDDGYYINNYLDNEALFSMQAKTIRHLADKESCIFVGRCADYVLREYPQCISIFIIADMEDRIERIAKQNQVSEDKAKKLIEHMDKRRASYYNYHTDKKWGMSTSYHLSINSSCLGISETAFYIREFVEKKWSK